MDPESVKRELLSQLHSAVKACQRRFGGRRELASDSSESCVSSLLTAWEQVLNHGLNQPLSQLQLQLQQPQLLLPILPASINQFTSTISGLWGGSAASGQSVPTFWQALRELLSPEEAARFTSGDERSRCRAWLRERMNEASMERFVHTYLGDAGLLTRHYRPDAFVRDPDLCAALPNLAAGVSSILFAVSSAGGQLDNGSGGSCNGDAADDDCAVELAAVAIEDAGPQFPMSGSGGGVGRRRPPPRPVVVSFDDDDAVSSAGSELSVSRADGGRPVPPPPPPPPLALASSLHQHPAALPPLASESGYNTSACSENDAASSSATWFSVAELRQALLDVSQARKREASERRHAEDQCRALQAQIGQLRRENGLLCQEVGREERLTRLAEMHADLSELSAQLQQSLAQASRELESLRGPAPRCPQYPLYVWIVGAFKRGAGLTRHHVYQIYCQTPSYDWSAFRRYQQFLDFHLAICQQYPDIADFYFPPKVSNSLRDEVAKQRMRSLQTYLRDVVNYLCGKVPGLTQEPCLRQHLPLLLDKETLASRLD